MDLAGKTIVVKIGGSTLGSHDTTIQDLVELQEKGARPVVVHGGGKTITDWLNKQGIASKFVRGLRVTDADGLQVVVAVLAGLVNKDLVAGLNGLGAKAIGLCGVDGRLIEAKIKEPELGYVGEVTRINLAPLEAIISAGYIPVIAPIGSYDSELWQEDAKTSDLPLTAASCLNLNADTAAGEIAAALKADALVFLTDVPGINDKEGKLIESIDAAHGEGLIASGVVSGGMIPKVEACLRAVTAIPKAHIVDGRNSNALVQVLSGTQTGTTVCKIR